MTTKADWIEAMRERYGSPMLAHRVESGRLTLAQGLHLLGFENQSFDAEPPPREGQLDLFAGPPE